MSVPGLLSRTQSVLDEWCDHVSPIRVECQLPEYDRLYAWFAPATTSHAPTAKRANNISIREDAHVLKSKVWSLSVGTIIHNQLSRENLSRRQVALSQEDLNLAERLHTDVNDRKYSLRAPMSYFRFCMFLTITRDLPCTATVSLCLSEVARLADIDETVVPSLRISRRLSSRTNDGAQVRGIKVHLMYPSKMCDEPIVPLLLLLEWLDLTFGCQRYFVRFVEPDVIGESATSPSDTSRRVIRQVVKAIGYHGLLESKPARNYSLADVSEIIRILTAWSISRLTQDSNGNDADQHTVELNAKVVRSFARFVRGARCLEIEWLLLYLSRCNCWPTDAPLFAEIDRLISFDRCYVFGHFIPAPKERDGLSTTRTLTLNELLSNVERVDTHTNIFDGGFYRCQIHYSAIGGFLAYHVRLRRIVPLPLNVQTALLWFLRAIDNVVMDAYIGYRRAEDQRTCRCVVMDCPFINNADVRIAELDRRMSLLYDSATVSDVPLSCRDIVSIRPIRLDVEYMMRSISSRTLKIVMLRQRKDPYNEHSIWHYAYARIYGYTASFRANRRR